MINTKLFETEAEFNAAYYSEEYLEPWTSYVIESDRVTYNKTEEEKLLETPLTFEILSSGSVKWYCNNTAHARTIEYRKNGGEWTPITATTAGVQIRVATGDVLQFRGDNITYSSGKTYYNKFFTASGATFNVRGNIMSLINSTNFITLKDLPNSSYTFYGLFASTSCNVVDASGLMLPATALTEGCYCVMFSGCSYLNAAPELPATTLANNCYESMFENCASLTTGPTKIGNSTTIMPASACANMFKSASKLTVAPELPATTMGDYCYVGMFSSCRSLTVAPELPATTLARLCYNSMFSRSGIITAPVLPATTLAEWCYSSMFYFCSGLTSVPELPATTLADYCYYQMFYYCTGLANIPSILPATTLATGCYSNMFYNCTSLTTAPELPATTLADSCYYNMFGSCSGLTKAPSSIGTSATTMAASACSSMFSSCKSLTTAPELPATTLAESCYQYMFGGCVGLTTMPTLPATILAQSCYYGMFMGCTSLTTLLTPSATTLAPNCYTAMFQNCKGLITTPSNFLPITALSQSCYVNMFEGCTSLTTAPELPAITLANYCYQGMFRDCTNLNYIKCLATTNVGGSNTDGWVRGVQTTSGTFVKNSGITESRWGRGINGIPANWTLQNA